MVCSQALINNVALYVKTHMKNYDASHDFKHIKRVVDTARTLYFEVRKTQPELDLDVITLSALLHDVGDRKYLKKGEDSRFLIRDKLLELGADQNLAERVNAICLGVSYTSEVQDFPYVKELICKYPELAVVQDADRLDAIGGVGIGRAFTYGGAKTDSGMDGPRGTMELWDTKLLKLEGLMKTEVGREEARKRIERLRVFKEWYEEETRVGEMPWNAEEVESEGAV